MLAYDEDKRFSAQQCLQHKWLTNMSDDGAANVTVNPKAIQNLKMWHGTQRFKKVALTAIATQLSEAEIKTLKDTFQALDKNGDGTLTLDEVQKGCKQHKVALPANFEEVFKSIDSDGSGRIDWTEFVASTMDKSMQNREDLLWAAFRVFDTDGNGQITRDELGKVLGNMDGVMDPEEFGKIDLDGNGVIDFEEFKEMMRK